MEKVQGSSKFPGQRPHTHMLQVVSTLTSLTHLCAFVLLPLPPSWLTLFPLEGWLSWLPRRVGKQGHQSLCLARGLVPMTIGLFTNGYLGAVEASRFPPLWSEASRVLSGHGLLASRRVRSRLLLQGIFLPQLPRSSSRLFLF